MRKKTDAGNPGDWLLFAEADLSAARVLLQQRVALGVCRSKAAEAIEKALKADLISRGWFLVKIHDIQKLNDELAVRDPALAANLQSVVDELANAYVESRYPGFDLEDSDVEELEALLKSIEAYIRALADRFGQPDIK